MMSDCWHRAVSAGNNMSLSMACWTRPDFRNSFLNRTLSAEGTAVACSRPRWVLKQRLKINKSRCAQCNLSICIGESRENLSCSWTSHNGSAHCRPELFPFSETSLSQVSLHQDVLTPEEALIWCASRFMQASKTATETELLSNH